MADSLRDQLLKSGIVKQVQQDRVRETRRPAVPQPKSNAGRRGEKPNPRPPAPPAKHEHEIDLAKAYTLRTQTETRERRKVEKEVAEQARLRRERKAKIQQLLEGKALNTAEADLSRNFEYGGKIRRVHVGATQLAALNAGELGVVQYSGRYLLVSREVAEQVRDIDAHQVAVLADPGTQGIGEDGVPDDLIW
jgi:uncharacterized protein YaiL (DUF2058 family)